MIFHWIPLDSTGFNWIQHDDNDNQSDDSALTRFPADEASVSVPAPSVCPNLKTPSGRSRRSRWTLNRHAALSPTQSLSLGIAG